MAMALWQTLKDSITTCTGVSPATFFTVVPVTIACYYLVFVVFGSSSAAGNRYQRAGHVAAEMQLPPLPPPVQVGEITEEELKEYDGSDPKKPLLMAIKGQIYDVSLSRMFYGPGGPYALFAGRDASRALAKMSFEEKDLTGDISGLGPFELEALQDWEYKFKSKYMKVGTVKKTVLVNGESSSPGQPLARTNEDVLEPPMEGGSMVEPEAAGEEKGE